MTEAEEREMCESCACPPGDCEACRYQDARDADDEGAGE